MNNHTVFSTLLEKASLVKKDAETLTPSIEKAEQGLEDINLKSVKAGVDRSKSLAVSFISMHEKLENEQLIEVKKQKAIRKAERQDLWLLWFNKLIRWAAGIVAGVLLYSVLVAASQYFPAIKIPVRDWFLSSDTNTMT